MQYVKLSGLRRLEQAETVCDIQVEEDESFSVAGVVVHNCFLNEANNSLDGIVGLWSENVWLASKGGGIGSY